MDLCAEEIRNSQKDNKRKNDNLDDEIPHKKLHTSHLTERDVGITERIAALSPYSGIIKQRYSDFIVNEIDVSGKIIQLTNTVPPVIEPKVLHDVDDILRKDIIDQLSELNAKTNSTEIIAIKEKCNSKEYRRKIHETIRQNFPKLCSNVEDQNGQKVIIIHHSNNKAAEKKETYRKAPTWPSNQPNYTKFVMYKENIDTMEAINTIAKFFRMKPSNLTYAGVKDKRAKTTQAITVYRVPADKLANLKLRDITLGNYEFMDTALKLGDLSGNRFKIVVRKLTGEGNIEPNLISLKENGFINYYGMQRFGTTTIPTHHIGKALLLGNWQEAVELILKPRHGDDDHFAEFRRLWWETRDAEGALEKLHRKNSIEGFLLRGLIRHAPNDLVNALNFIPRNTRLMYIHSYQSYLWNLLVSKRIKEYGLKMIEGDLICKVNDEKNEKNDKFVPSFYTAENGVNNVCILDVVMPLPGCSSIKPDNKIAQWYNELLEEEGITVEDFSSKVKSYSLQGGYRKFISKPADLVWSLKKYSDVTKPLVFSDLDIMNEVDSLSSPESDDSFCALTIEMSLPSSSYATMALREVINVDTSAAFQSSMN